MNCYMEVTFTNKDTQIIVEMKEHPVGIRSLPETKTEGKGNIKMNSYIIYIVILIYSYIQQKGRS